MNRLLAAKLVATLFYLLCWGAGMSIPAVENHGWMFLASLTFLACGLAIHVGVVYKLEGRR